MPCGFSGDTGIRVIQLAGYDVYYEPTTLESRQRYCDGMERALEVAAQHQVMLALEIMDTPFLNSITKYLKLKERLRHFASRGAVAVAAETRTSARHGTGPVEAIEDARDLIRWLRHNADTFNLDPQRVIIGGAGGGAFLALLATMPKPRHMPPVDGLDCRPQALVLFSALVNTTPKGQGSNRFPNPKTAKHLSPSQLVRRKLPPMLFFHGKSDRITPFDEVERFCRRMRWRGNSCELVDFVREDHSFFNFNVSQKNFELTIGAADRFLVDHGFLLPEESP